MHRLGHVDAARRVARGGGLSLPVLNGPARAEPAGREPAGTDIARARQAGESSRGECRELPRRLRKSRIAPWRAAALFSVYILMTAHIVHWQVAGKTMAPVVFSDSMQTLEAGRINPGFILFAAAILATAVLGRFFCGWACHMGALQDGCAWLLRRVGLRPHLFRSRLLGYVPLGLAIYMFLWPTLKREAILPALSRWWPEALAYLQPVPPFPGLSANLVTDDLWAGLPGPAVAVPFLLICGCATVYFLGSRGLCRYACPYGGFLLPVEQIAPGRIVVDMARCDGCGHCTAACTSGVRVHEEVREFGRVVSRDCVRSLDCISVCPQDALSFGLARPAAGPRSRSGRASRKYDLSWGEEVLAIGVFGATLVAIRGIYGVMPFLMVASIAVIAAFGACKLWSLARRRDVRLGGLQLKRAGRLRPAGRVFAGLGLLGAALVLQCAAVRYCRWRGDELDAKVTVGSDVIFAGRFAEVPEEARQAAGEALDWYRRGSSFRHGGIGLADTTAIQTRGAWLHLVRGELTESESAMQRAIARNGPTDSLCLELSRITLLAGRFEDALAYLRQTHEAHPRFRMVRDQLCNLHLAGGRVDEAIGVCRAAIRRRPDDAPARTALASILFSQGNVAGALEELRLATSASPRDTHALTGLAEVSFVAGLVDEATGALSRAAEVDPKSASMFLSRGAEMLSASGREAEAGAWRDRAAAGAPGR
jgi:polyferredoxin/Flp pilus assembly protein TadD